MKKLLAFTLAETLIVIGIIGVVSALTLPNLNSSTGEKEKVAKVKKIYQNLDDAVGRAIAVYGPLDEWIVSDTTVASQSTRFAQRISEFLKVSKDCGVTANRGCFSSRGSIDSSSNIYKIIVADGASIGFVTWEGHRLDIYVDIDGPQKGSEIDGNDKFTFVYADGFFHPLGRSNPTGAFDSAGYDDYIWVFYHDNMDYLKCANVLNWETKTSCK